MTDPGSFLRAAVLGACVACNATSPAKDVSRDQVDASVVATRSTSGASECASDADCRTVSSYCNERPCACLVLAKGAPDPSCAGPSSVRCLVDPCRGKAAACQDGQCILASGAVR